MCVQSHNLNTQSQSPNVLGKESMNQRFWNGFTAALLVTALGTATASYAEPTKPGSQDAEEGVTTSVRSEEEMMSASTSAPNQAIEVVKVGEFQSQPEDTATEQEAIAKINVHEINGRQAATLSVQRIPVLTFLSSQPAAANRTQAAANGTKKAASTANPNSPSAHRGQANNPEDDAVWRATAVAARLNQLYRENVDAEAIAVTWKQECNCYAIQVNGEELVTVNEQTILPDTTRNLEVDALQATNRLRRLMGNAAPLREVAGKPIPQPQKPTQIAVGPLRLQVNGLASWYGPGFHGRRSASGERFNQNAMTAAHRHLPFGTQVRVTNVNNGRSVVVRINDRGPYARGRVIDLSAAAAKVLGLVQTGVAPVQIDVLGK
jgi:rare lipoprotein A